MTKTFSNVRIAAVALLVSGFVAVAPAAHAADEGTLPSFQLKISATDFSSPTSVDHLVRRVRHLALNVCTEDSPYQQGLNAEQRTCYDTAVKNGLAQIEARQQEAMRATSVHMASAQPETAPTR